MEGLTLEQLQALGAKPVEKTGGLSLEQLQALGAKPVEVEQKGLPRLASNVGGALSNVITGTVEGLKESYNKQMAEVKELQEESVGASGLDKLKGIGEFGLRTVGNTIGAAFSPVAPIVSELGKGIGNFGEMIGVNDDVGAVVDKIKGTDAYKYSEEKIKSALVKYGEWAEKNPDMAKDTEALAEIALLLVGAKPAQSAVKGSIKTGKEVAESTVKTIRDVGGSVGGSVGGAISAVEKPIAGIGQNIKEGVQAIPRVVERVGAGLEKSADKATRLKTATPEVKKAIESGLDDKIINFVTEADDVTKNAMKKVVRMAEEKPVLGKTNQPSVIAGDLAVKQYNLIDAEKKRIGKQLGDRINALSKTTTVDIKDSLTSLDDILNSQGILKTLNKKGKIELDFTTSKFSKAERTKISELYELATEGGSKLTPAQIKAKDQLFSKMQRESKMESIGDIIIDTPEGQKNLFQAFRDVYNSKLDSIDPTIRELNRKYAELARITDDIEDSILKTPNFNITKSADQSEFAKVNLRRIFAENQSSAVYEDIVNQMDDWARVLGYTDASPKEIMDFSLEMRKLFPETIPKTGFTGGINAGVESTIINTLGKALTSGKPNLIDQQKALKALLGIDDVILPKLNKVIEPSSKIDINLPKKKVDKVELPPKTAKIDANIPKNEGITVYRGGKQEGKYFSTSKSVAEDFAKNRGGNVSEMVIKPEAKIANYSDFPDAKYKNINDYNINTFSQGKDLKSFQDTILENEYVRAEKWAKDNGYDVIKLPTEGEMRVINKNVIKSKSWNKAQEKSTTKININDILKKYPSYSTKEIENIVSSLEGKISKAPESKKYIDNIADSVSSKIEGVYSAKADIKSFDRSLEKIIKEENGNVESLRDLARNTIIANKGEQTEKVIKMLDSRNDVFKKKIQDPENYFGYSGIIYNIKTPNGLISEIQVVSPEMMFAKNPIDFSKKVLGEKKFNEIQKKYPNIEPGKGHILYEKIRELPVDVDIKIKTDLIEESFRYYNQFKEKIVN